MAIKNEIFTPSYPYSISYDGMKKIKKQMKYGICKLEINNNDRGTGFFCKIPFPYAKNKLKVLITNNHLIDEEYIKNNSSIKFRIKSEKNEIKISLKDRIIFTNKEYDTTIIEIKENDEIKYFLKLNEKIINDIIKNKNENNDFIDQTIYMTHYPLTILSMSSGIVESIDDSKKYFFYHKCNSNDGSSGSPIFSVNNEVFGIHKGINISENNSCGIGIFLNYPIKKFINEMKLKNINERYQLRIKSIDIEKLCLFNQEEEGLKELGDIQFDKLKELKLHNNNKKVAIHIIKSFIEKIEELDLRDNKPFDIEIENELNFKVLKKIKLNFNFNVIVYFLDKVNFKKLEILDLSINNISDISFLTKVNYPELKELNLNKNNIANIKALENAKFEKLEILNLGLNQISEIDALAKTNFKNLKNLILEKNNISNITSLSKFDFPKLEILNLSYNNISDIGILNKVNFKYLKELYLNNNKISDINTLKNIEFKFLEVLTFAVNDISDINVLEHVYLKELKQLFLCANKISDISVLAKVDFPKLTMLSFGVNNITNIDVLEKVNFKDMEVLGFSKNKISDINIFSKINFEKLKHLSFDDNHLDENKEQNKKIIIYLKDKIKRFFPFSDSILHYYINKNDKMNNW